MRNLLIVFSVVILGSCFHTSGQAPLKLKTSVSNTCLGDNLKLYVEITNISDKKTTIDQTAAWSMISFRHDGDSRTIVNESLGSEAMKTIVLPPRRRFKTSRIIKLSGHFFDKPGVYEVSVTYATFGGAHRQLWIGTVKSEYEDFRLDNCPPRRFKNRQSSVRRGRIQRRSLAAPHPSVTRRSTHRTTA